MVFVKDVFLICVAAYCTNKKGIRFPELLLCFVKDCIPSLCCCFCMNKNYILFSVLSKDCIPSL